MTEDHNEVIRNFYRIRQILGILGFCLPILLLLGGLMGIGRAEPSISDYYHTVMRDFYVGIMFAIGIFLICYTGHRRGDHDRFSDDIVTTIAGVAALIVAIFPNGGALGTIDDLSFTQALFGKKAVEIIHYIAAVIFLGSAGHLSFFRFARTAIPNRRLIYKTCALIIWGMTLVVIITSYLKLHGPATPQAVVRNWKMVFWFETLGIWAFSVAWLVKGRIDLSLLHALGVDLSNDPKGHSSGPDA